MLSTGLVLLGTVSLTSAQESTEETADHILAAEEALNERRYQDAARHYLQAAEQSDSAEVAKTATRIAYSYGFNEDALRGAQRWSELEPDSDEARLYVAQLQLRTGELRDAEDSFLRLLEDGEQAIDEQLLRLIPLLGREDPEDAYEVMRRLARPYRDSPYANYAVAVLALEAGELEIASDRASDAIELDPDWVRPHLVYARAMLLLSLIHI